MSTDLVVRDTDIIGPDALERASEAIERLIQNESSGDLDEIRIAAEAQALYEQRAKNAERERHFWTLKTLAEAGLGVLSLDGVEVFGRKENIRNECRTLAAAYERGDLLKLCRTKERPRGRWAITNEIRKAGYTFARGKDIGNPEAASIRWSEARLIAKDNGIPLTQIPPDKHWVRENMERYHKQGANLRQAWAAKARLERMKSQAATAKAAKEIGPRVDLAYGLLRKALQATHDAQDDVPRRRRPELDEIFFHLYGAEDALGRFIRGET